MNLAHLKQVAQAATQGPWSVLAGHVVHEEGEGYVIITPPLNRRDNAAYIAAFDPPTMLALITHIEKLEATIQRVRDLHPPRPNSMSALYPTPLCACGKNYPCPTTQALEGDPNE